MKRHSSGRPELDFSTLQEATIRRISPHPRRPDRYIIRFVADSEVVHKVLITDEALVQLSLRAGEVIHIPRIAELADAVGRTRAADAAALALAARPRSRRELERSMGRKGISVIHIAEALDRLERVGVLDDTAFAAGYVRSKVAGRGLSRRAIERDLFRKGIGAEAAREAIDAVLAEQGLDELAIARREAARRWRSLERLEPLVAKRRLLGFLGRRGFSGDVVRTVVRELMGR